MFTQYFPIHSFRGKAPVVLNWTMSKHARSGKNTRGQSSRSQERAIDEKVRELGIFDNDNLPMSLLRHP
ncbi:hypothetical protein Tco_1168892 [Tanacetum coccineum]